MPGMEAEGARMLNDCNVMLVEDEALLALDLSLTLEDLGARVSGPFATAESALPACGDVDFAILDVDLWGGKVYPVADRLRAANTPFVFHTGRADCALLRRRYGDDVRVIEKPARRAEILRELSAIRERV